MTYISPFYRTSEDHDGEGHACLSRFEHDLDPVGANAFDFWKTFAHLSPDLPTDPDCQTPGPVLFYLGRHLTELLLKQWAPSGTTGHKLDELLSQVPDSHQIQQPCHEHLREFILELAICDPAGDEGRYGTKRGGEPSLSDICCMDTSVFTDFVGCLVALNGGGWAREIQGKCP